MTRPSESPFPLHHVLVEAERSLSHQADESSLDHDVLRAVLRVLAEKWEAEARSAESSFGNRYDARSLRHAAQELRGVVNA
jgi:hypothetical protein